MRGKTCGEKVTGTDDDLLGRRRQRGDGEHQIAFSRLQYPPFVGPESDIYSHSNKVSDLQGLVSPILPQPDCPNLFTGPYECSEIGRWGDLGSLFSKSL